MSSGTSAIHANAGWPKRGKLSASSAPERRANAKSNIAIVTRKERVSYWTRLPQLARLQPPLAARASVGKPIQRLVHLAQSAKVDWQATRRLSAEAHRAKADPSDARRRNQHDSYQSHRTPRHRCRGG